VQHISEVAIKVNRVLACMKISFDLNVICIVQIINIGIYIWKCNLGVLDQHKFEGVQRHDFLRC